MQWGNKLTVLDQTVEEALAGEVGVVLLEVLLLESAMPTWATEGQLTLEGDICFKATSLNPRFSNRAMISPTSLPDQLSYNTSALWSKQLTLAGHRQACKVSFRNQLVRVADDILDHDVGLLSGGHFGYVSFGMKDEGYEV